MFLWHLPEVSATALDTKVTGDRGPGATGRWQWEKRARACGVMQGQGTAACGAAGAHGRLRRGLLETVSHVTKQSHLCGIRCISDVIRRERGGPRCSVSRHVTAQARELGASS